MFDYTQKLTFYQPWNQFVKARQIMCHHALSPQSLT